MPSRKKFVVWEWRDRTGPRFVGWGRKGRNHPAKDLWARRRGQRSDLNNWFLSFDSEPERKDHTAAVPLYRHEASHLSTYLREKYRREGYTLLDPRPWGTKSGGGMARTVMSPDWTIYGSVRQAAVDNGVHPCTITRLCQRQGSGWDYLN